MKGDQRRRPYQRIRGGWRSSGRFHHQTIAVNLPRCPAAPQPAPLPPCQPRLFLGAFKPGGRVVPHTARKVSGICSRHFRHLPSFNSHGGVYRAPTKRRSTAGAESGAAALCAGFLFLTRVDVVVRAANNPLARGALLRDLTSTRWQSNGTSHPEVAALAALSRRVRDARTCTRE